MQCEVYKGSKKEQTYLYVEKPIDQDELPETLLDMLGELSFVMTLELSSATHLVAQDAQVVIDQVNEKGFYLQLPPKIYA